MSYREKEEEKVGDCTGLHGVFLRNIGLALSLDKIRRE